MVLHDGPTFNFNTYEVFKAAELDANKVPGCKRVMYKKVPVDESVEDRLARMEEDREANAQIIAMFCRDGRNNLTAITVIWRLEMYKRKRITRTKSTDTLRTSVSSR